MDTLSQESDFLTNSDMETILNDLHGENGQFKSTNEPYGQSTLPHLQPVPLQEDLTLHEDLVALDQDLSVAVPSPTDTIPSREYYQGPLNFELLLDSSKSGKKSWVYSTPLNKLFLDMGKSLLIGFKVIHFVPHMLVRALAVYSGDDYINEPVERCQFHSLHDDPFQLAHARDQPGVCQCDKFNMARHLMMSSHSQAMYNYDAVSNRHSVLVPLDSPPAGSDYTVVEYRFTCKTSCSRGMNRRPIQVIFTLETADCRVLGRQPIGVKICSCPKRDKEKEEEDANKAGEQCYGTGKRKMPKNMQGLSKKIKSEVPAATQEGSDQIEGEQNKTDLSYLERKLDAMATEQSERLRHLEAKVDAVAEHMARVEAETAEHLRRVEAKLDAMINIQWKG